MHLFPNAMLQRRLHAPGHGHFAAPGLIDGLVKAFQSACRGGKHRSRGSGPNIFQVES
jgi:hypothetical protein